jgi:plasmid stabilization system protein ParE
MSRLIWLPTALEDTARLHAFLKRKNPDAAMRAVAAIRRGVRILETHPHAGRPVERMDSGFKEWPISFGRDGYVVLYRYDGDDVCIVAVKHSREAGY